MEALWTHHNIVAQRIRINAHRIIAESVLLYNCGTWALTEVLSNTLDCTQRKMIRRVLGIKLSDRITTNADVYARCGIQPASIQVINARWRLFVHTLRMSQHAPARKAMAYYFIEDHDGRSGKRATIATALSDEYKEANGISMKSLDEYEAVVDLAQDRGVWKELFQKITDEYIRKYEEKVQKKKQTRIQAKRAA